MRIRREVDCSPQGVITRLVTDEYGDVTLERSDGLCVALSDWATAPSRRLRQGQIR